MSISHATNTTAAAPATDLRLALRADAAASGLAGLLLTLGGSVVDAFTGLPAPLLHGAGAFLVLWATALGVLASRPILPRPAVWTVIIVNAVWVFDSVVVLVTGMSPVTGWGAALVLGMATVVSLFAAWQFQGLRRAN